MASPTEFADAQKTAANRHASAELPNGIVVTTPFPHARNICIARRFQGLVQQSPHWHG
jgi:hypothetical protein